MLRDQNSSAIVATRDLQRSKQFYTETLDLDVADEMDGVFSVKTGGTVLNVYESKEAGTNRANAVVWDCGDDFDDIVEDLRSRGVAFETYPGLGLAIQDGVHVSGDFKAAWFKDPDGNILHINTMGGRAN